ncbi:MAG: YbjN domain-containing protein [Gemmatimonadota bacterium]|nr:YbjN domain-containing protein [Gemmatimonadota bacterium]
MLTTEDIEAWLDRLDSGSAEVSEVEPGLWMVRTAAGAEVLVNFAPPVAILRVTVMTLPAGTAQQAKLCRQLLEYNARDLVHGAYGLEGDKVVLVDTLELENLDFNEFEASFESMTLAIATHLGALAPYRE